MAHCGVPHPLVCDILRPASYILHPTFCILHSIYYHPTHWCATHRVPHGTQYNSFEAVPTLADPTLAAHAYIHCRTRLGCPMEPHMACRYTSNAHHPMSEGADMRRVMEPMLVAAGNTKLLTWSENIIKLFVWRQVPIW